MFFLVIGIFALIAGFAINVDSCLPPIFYSHAIKVQRKRNKNVTKQPCFENETKITIITE